MQQNNIKLAFKVTLHCVVGCGIGDTAGLIIGTVFGWSVILTMILGIILGFLGGYGLTMWPLLKNGLNFKIATKITIASETVSIIFMETGENLTAFLIPGLLTATIFSSFFWFGVLVSISAGFLAAYPINYFMIIRGLKHGHIHN